MIDYPTKSNWLGIKGRLDKIALHIADNPLTIEQIAEHIDGNKRTTYRDILKLIRLGYPVQNNKGHYWIPTPNHNL